MADLETTIQQLEEKLRQAKAKQAQINARKRAAEAKKQRQEDTRRKVLVGAVVLAEMERGGYIKSTIERLLDQHLRRDADRALFGMKPKAVSVLALPEALEVAKAAHATTVAELKLPD